MQSRVTVAVDLAKTVFQGVVADEHGMRGLLREFGLICSVGAEKLMKALPVLLQEHSVEVPPRGRTLLWQMHQEVRDLEARIDGADNKRVLGGPCNVWRPGPANHP